VIIALHLAAALASLALGPAIFLLRKGTPLHRVLGRAWGLLMLVTALSSFWIAAGNARAHRKFMVWTYVGLVAAGVAAVAAPGRTLHFFFFA
jgi:uncharacterized membrane protein